MTKNKIALISGASSGIGQATARLFAKHHMDLILCGRRKDRLLELEQELGSLVSVKTLCFDVRSKEEVFSAIESLPSSLKIDILINNAGNAHGASPFQDGNLEDFDAMIDINVKGLIYVSKAVIPRMLQDRAHIINMGSLAGKEVYLNGNVYCASKHAIDALTAGLRLDLNKTQIKVSSINPGLVETEFSLVRFKGDRDKAKSIYAGYEPLRAADVAETILFMVKQPWHVNISDVTILPTAQASANLVHKN
ncbi:MAG: SDR family NAD(P)-dependent oxidoreductase [Oligoflexales bacterium]|nr:SDR family NAD(P)-dependent oxidoreductase [Oligoflexales bacterium]